MKCTQCDMNQNCIMVKHKCIKPKKTVCGRCTYSETSFHKEPCIYCHVYAMDGHCNFEKKVKR